MAALYLLSNAWGPKAGGINAFNTDFAKALGLALGERIPVGCVVLEADDADRIDAERSRVRLVAIGKSPTHGDFDPARAYDIANALREQELPVDGACWVGNDIISADVALRMRDVVADATVVLIHHMSYLQYTGFKHGVGQIAKDKHERQRALFAGADRTFGVGPLLRDSLADLLPARSPEPGLIVPGLPEVSPRVAPKVFTACSFGRLDPENDRIKQGRLAVAGFAALVARSGQPGMPKGLRRPPQLQLIGIGKPGGDEEQGLRSFADQRAGRALNLLALPYHHDRQRLLDDLAGSSAALMLSWHEGFGLTGWEAIGAEVPLILSTNSGLYELIEDRLGGAGTGCVHAIDVHGRSGVGGGTPESDEDPIHFTDDDVDRVSDALLDIARDPDGARADAKRLRQMLMDEGCTWQNAARRFANDLGLPLPPLPEPQLEPRQRATAPGAASGDAQVPGQGAESDEQPDDAKPPDAPGAAALLDIPRRHPDPLQAAALLSESRLLRVDTECVPFHAEREPVLQDLLGWATDPAGFHAAVQLRVGAGGLGKTRLLRELCHRLNARGWHAGFLRSGVAFHGGDLTALLRRHAQVLVVVDYAETRRETLIPLLRAALNADPACRLRIMLLARSAGDWWDRLKEDHGPELEDFLTGPAVRGPFAVPPVPADVAGRERLYREAQAAFAEKLGADEALAAPPPDLSPVHFAEVLPIHLAALAGLNSERPETATELLDAQLRREARYWQKAAADRGLGDRPDRALPQALALITLADGAPGMQRVRELVARSPALAGTTPAEHDDLVALLRAFYPRDGGVDALRPDLLGERLVARELARDDSLLDLCLGPAAEVLLRRSALTLLNRLARHDAAAEVWLRMGLTRYPTACADDLLAVAVESGDPAGRVFAGVLDKAEAKQRIALCDRLAPMLPESTVVLSELAEVVTRHRLEAVRRKAGKSPGKKDRFKLLKRYTQHGGRLRALGRLEKSRAAVEEALDLARRLARSGDPAAELNVATSLSNLGAIWLELGAFEDAERYGREAVQIRERQPAGQLSPQAMEAQRAAVLGNYGNTLSGLGKLDAALDYANHALDILRRLAQARPDAHESDLARSLSNLGKCLSDLGRYEDALLHSKEALSIYRDLAQARPDAYEFDLATSLNNVGVFFSEIGWYEDALVYAENALVIYRRLAEARPGAHAVNLARSLANLASIQLGRWQPDAAALAASEAVELLGDRAGDLGRAIQRERALALGLHAWALLETGEIQAAAEQSAAAVALWERLLAETPAGSPQGAALGYWIGWRCALAAGDDDSAAARARLALEVIERWIGNGAEALPAYLIEPAKALLETAEPDRYPQARGLLARFAGASGSAATIPAAGS